MKQGDISFKEFVTKTQLMLDDSGYDVTVKDDTLRPGLLFGLRSDKVNKDVIAFGDTWTLNQVSNLARIEEGVQA